MIARTLVPCLGVLAVACSLTTEPDFRGWPHGNVRFSGELAFTFRVEEDGDTVRVIADVRNVGVVPDTMVFGACSWGVRGETAFGSWDNRLGPEVACISIGYYFPLQTGESNSRVVYRRALGDLRSEAGPGFNRISVFIRANGAVRRFSAGSLWL